MSAHEFDPMSLRTLSPEKRDQVTREVVSVIACNLETLTEELRDILASGGRFERAPEVWVEWLASAEAKLATAVSCAARCAGLVVAK